MVYRILSPSTIMRSQSHLSMTTMNAIDFLNCSDIVMLSGLLQADYDYDADNRLTKITFGNGTEEIR